MGFGYSKGSKQFHQNPITPQTIFADDGAYGDGETPVKKKKKKKDKKRDGDEGQLPSTIQNETAVSNIMDDSSAATTSSKKSKKKKKKSEQWKITTEKWKFYVLKLITPSTDFMQWNLNLFPL